MKVERVKKIRNYRIFRDFDWPDDLSNFSRYNLIYGWNGSGKTTLSNIFSCLASKEDITQGIVTLQIGGEEIEGTSFSASALPDVRVFNKNSVARSTFEVPDHEFPPVFYLGEDSAEKQKKIEGLKSEREVLRADKHKLRAKESSAVKNLDEFNKNKALEIKSLLTSSGMGSYNNYNKSNFATKVESLLNYEAAPYCLLPEAYNQFLAIKESAPLQTINSVPTALPDYQQIVNEVQDVLERIIVSNTLAALSEKPAIAAWVQQGLELHNTEDNEIHCHFCTNSVQPERVESLEAHFNEQLTKFQQEVDLKIANLQKSSEQISKIDLPNEAQFYPQLQSSFKSKLFQWNAAKNNINFFLNTLIKALGEKREHPFRKLDLRHYLSVAGSSEGEKSTLKTILETLGDVVQTFGVVLGLSSIAEIDKLIAEHNQFTQDFEKKVKKARSILEAHTASINLEEYREKNSAITAVRLKAAENEQKLVQCDEKLKQLESEVKEFVRPAEELNTEMAAYLGRNELQFQVRDNGYVISRNGQPAMNLSEGEKTAIAFMYFLKTLEDASFNMETGIVVIDDPISSLDSNSMYSAFGFMKARTHHVNQLFVLTHSFNFFRHVRRWFYDAPKLPAIQGHQGSNDYRTPSRFYMLATTKGQSDRGALIADIDPLLKDYESEYHYLFKVIHDFVETDGNAELETYYGLPNIARRLLESFLTFKMPNFNSDSIVKKLDAVSFDPAKKNRILRFLHVHSHYDQIGAPEHDLSLLAESPAVLRDLVDLMKELDSEHYNGMSLLCRSTDENTTTEAEPM